MTQRRFVVLDRDGTIIVERQYLSHPSQLELIPRVAGALRQLVEMGLGLVVVTNQSGIGRGFFDEAQVGFIHQRMCELLEMEGVYVNGIYVCPHRLENDCSCRKPRPGLLELAARELDFDPQTCFVIGDKACDIELGRRVGATTFLVRTGYGIQLAAENTVTPDYVADDVWAAAQIIKHLLTADERREADATRG